MMDAEMLKNMPKCIPGFYLEPERDNFARSQRFATVKGIRMEVEEGADKPKMVRTERPADLMATAKGYATRATTNAKNHPAFNEKTTDDLPAWDALDRHVLRFYGYFQEAVTESNLENYRVRRVIVYYYLEDDTMHVSEPRMDNSGCPSGSLIRRHRIPSGEGSGYIKPEDILVGVDLVLYGKTIRITDCDAFTRGYAKDHNYSLADAQDVPQDNFCAIQERAKALEAVKPRTYEKIYREMMMGGGHINTNMQQFMENDRKVCRFYAVMDDTLTAQYERRPCTIFSFLADDTIEIREQYPLNCGRDNFPIFFKRGALEKAPGATVRGPMSPDQRGDVWKVEDLYVGLQAKFLSNTFLVYDADPYTRQYYKEVLGIELNPRIDVKLPEAEIPRPATPPYTGYGSWDDSMASVLNLIPKVPRRDFHKLMYNDRKSMRFTAMFNNAREEDVNRRFVVTLNLWDDTMAIHEPPQRNSGILSGSFLEKAVHLNQKTGRLFAPEDLLPGNIVQVLNHEFRMLDMDQATRTLLDSGGTAVPSANLTSVLEKVRENMRQQYPLVRDVFRRFDKDRNGVITLEEMKEALQKFAFHVTEDEVTCISVILIPVKMVKSLTTNSATQFWSKTTTTLSTCRSRHQWMTVTRSAHCRRLFSVARPRRFVVRHRRCQALSTSTTACK